MRCKRNTYQKKVYYVRNYVKITSYYNENIALGSKQEFFSLHLIWLLKSCQNWETLFFFGGCEHNLYILNSFIVLFGTFDSVPQLDIRVSIKIFPLGIFISRVFFFGGGANPAQVSISIHTLTFLDINPEFLNIDSISVLILFFSRAFQSE